jgi:tetratricopeptide (TPR) repeat protein
MLYQREGQVERAICQLKRAVELDGHLTASWVMLGDIHSSQANWPEAIRDYEMAIAQDSGLEGSLKERMSEAYSQSAMSLHQQGKAEEAEGHYLKALSLGRQDPALSYNLGNLYREKGELEKAEEAYRSSLQVDTGWAKAHLGLALTAEARKDWQAALSEWKLFVEKEPQSDLSGQVKERIEKISAALKPRQR